jgi:hypothetical protein
MELLSDPVGMIILQAVLSVVLCTILIRFTCWLNNVIAGVIHPGRGQLEQDSEQRAAECRFSRVPVPGFGDAFYLFLLAMFLFAIMAGITIFLTAVLLLIAGIQIDTFYIPTSVGCMVLLWLAFALVLWLLLPTNLRQGAFLALILLGVNAVTSAAIAVINPLIPWQDVRSFLEQ